MRTRLIAISLFTALWASAAQASVVGQVVGAVVGTAITATIAAKNKAKIANCTLYDREGNPVTVSCPADVAARANAATVVAAPQPVAVAAAPLPNLSAHGRVTAMAPIPNPPAYDPGPAPPRVTYLSGGLPEAHCISCTPIRPPPPPVVADCGCDHGAAYQSREYRDESVYQPRSVASFLSASGGHTEVTYSHPRVVKVYESYAEETTERFSYSEESRYGGGYSASYGGAYGGGGFTGGVGYGGGVGFHPYGGVGFAAGGYAGGGRSRVAGRDPNGFLTWPGKR